MFEKIFNGQSKTITSAAIMLGGASLVSRLFGVFRDRVLAGQFGAGAELDMYYAAFRLPDLIFNLLILGSLSAGFIPIFTGLLAKKNKAWELLDVLFNVICACLIVTVAALYFLAPWIIRLITPGFGEEQLVITAQLTRIMLLSLMFLGISGIFGSVLQSFKAFFIYSVAPILYNLGIIFGALFLVPAFGIYGLAWGVVIGAFLHMSIQLINVAALGYHWQWNFNLRNKGFCQIMKLMVPRTLGLVVTQINFLIVTIIGSTLAAGTITIFNLANNIQSFPLGLFGVSYAVAAFPTLSELAEKKKQFIGTLSLAVREILFFILPSTAFLIVLRAQIVRVILGWGRFNWEDTVITLETLAIFAVSLFAQALLLIVIRAYFALHDSKTPFFTGLLAAAVNVVLAVLFSRDYGVLGLALAFSISSILNLILLALILHYRLGKLDGERITLSAAKMLVAIFMLAITAQAAKYPIQQLLGLDTFLAVAMQAAAAVSAGGLAYFITCWLLKSEELNLFIVAFEKKILKKPKLPEEVMEQGPIVQDGVS